MRRWYAGLTLILLAVAGTAGFAIFNDKPGQFTAAQADQIKPGMTRDEVMAVMGCPPGDFTGGKQWYRDDDLHFQAAIEDNELWSRWCGVDGQVYVRWDREKSVAYYASFAGPYPPRTTLWQRVWQWINFWS